jgi:hypothetical protein
MGIGLVELNYRIEKRVGVRVPTEQWRQRMVDSRTDDLTAEDVCALIAKCRGREADEQLWRAVQEVVASVLAKDVAIDATRIKKSTRLLRDLKLVTS